MDKKNTVLDGKTRGTTMPRKGLTKRPKKGPKKRWVFVFIIMVAIIAFVLISGVKRTKKRLATAPVLQPRPVPVETAMVKIENLRNSMRFLARLEPVSTAVVSSRITANLKELYVDDGDAVKKGQLIAMLDDRDILADIASIKSTIKAFQSSLKSNQAMTGAAEKDYTYLKREYERDKKLFREQGISDSALDASKNRMDNADEKLKSLISKSSEIKHNLSSLAAKLDEVRTKLSYTKILSPSTGRVEKRLLEKGDLAQPGKPVFRIMNMTAYRLAINLVQDDLTYIHPGQKAVICWDLTKQQCSAKDMHDESAVLSRIFPALGTGRTIRAEIDLNDNVPEGVKIGSFIPVELVINEEKGLTVPRRAIIPVSSGAASSGISSSNISSSNISSSNISSFGISSSNISSSGKNAIVYAIRDNKIVPVKVKELFFNETRSLVTGDLQENEKVAVNEFLQWVRLNPGDHVEVIK